MCITTRRAPEWATASIAPSARKAFTSFTTAAPAPIASRITRGFIVSTETPMPRAASASTTGITRSSSRPSSTYTAPGRVDSPPTSTRSAPSSCRRMPCSIARGMSTNLPPSENESAVMLTMPITRGRDEANEKARGARRERATGRPFPCLSPRASCVLLGALRRRRGRLRATATVAAIARRRGARHRLGRARGAPGHDVVDLVRVDRLPLEQRLGHHLDLVAVFLEQAPRERVLPVDDGAHFLVHGHHHLFRHVLVRGHLAAEEDLAFVLAVHHRAQGLRHAPL